MEALFRNHLLPPFWSPTSLCFFSWLCSLAPCCFLILDYLNKTAFHFQISAWKQKRRYSRRGWMCSVAPRVLLQVLKGLFHKFLPAFCLGGEEGYSKESSESLEVEIHLRDLHPVRCFIYLGCSIHTTHKGCQKQPLTLGLSRLDIPTQKAFMLMSCCVKLIWLFISVSLTIRYFEFSWFQSSPVVKINNSPRIYPTCLVLRKTLPISAETRRASEAAVVCGSCISVVADSKE